MANSLVDHNVKLFILMNQNGRGRDLNSWVTISFARITNANSRWIFLFKIRSEDFTLYFVPIQFGTIGLLATKVSVWCFSVLRLNEKLWYYYYVHFETNNSTLLISSKPVKYFYSINHKKSIGHVMHRRFNIQQLYALPTLYLCALYLSENKQRLVPLTA